MDPNETRQFKINLKGVLEGGESALIYSPKDLHFPFFNDGNLIQ